MLSNMNIYKCTFLLLLVHRSGLCERSGASRELVKCREENPSVMRRAVGGRSAAAEGGRRGSGGGEVIVELVGGGNASHAERNASAAEAELLERFRRTWPVQLWLSTGLFEEGYLRLINRHWLQFPPPPPAVDYALGALYVVLMTVGCSGNALVVFMYFRCRSLRTPGNLLVLNLAVSDFFMLAKTPVFIFNSFYLGPALGKTGCTIYGFLGGLTGVTSIATLSAIAFDRYSVVVHPLEPLKTLNNVRAKLFAVSTWLYATLFSIVPALDIGYGRYVPEAYLTSCSFDYLSDEPEPRYFIFAFFCAAWLLPFSVIAFCYLNILRVVIIAKNMASNSEHRLSMRHVKEQTKRKAELKLAGLVIAVIILFFLSWTPYAIVSLLGIFGKRDVIIPIVSMVPALFCKSASCINPFIYIMSHPRFKSEFQKLVCRERAKRASVQAAVGPLPGDEKRRSLEVAREVSSEDDVEILEMRDIPGGGGEMAKEVKARGEVESVSARVSEKPVYSRKSSNNSFDSNVVPPPSWFKKPQFSQKRKSFRNKSVNSINSLDTRPTNT